MRGNDDNDDMGRFLGKKRMLPCRWGPVIITVAMIGLGFTIHYAMQEPPYPPDSFQVLSTQNNHEQPSTDLVPSALLGLVYQESDFENELGIKPPYWGCEDDDSCHNTTSSQLWGPCYAPLGQVDWRREAALYRNRPPDYNDMKRTSRSPSDLSNYCRPGFLIIGAGKCGTSSLYHYLTEHPRVLPAIEKQIHYFKYYYKLPMKWYLRHFPSARSFLGSGALMTGEASPGYLPYPDVARLVRRRLGRPKIMAVGREPLDRAYSSYRYNYVTPTLKRMQQGKVAQVPKGKPEQFYMKYLFSFEDMMKAELHVLRECLAPNGAGIVGARERWGQTQWGQAEYDRRESLGLPPLIDLENFCYGNKVNQTVLRSQWAEIVGNHPEKVILDDNLHLVQSLIGRSLYTLPLEWWYANFPASDIYFVCTEELSDLTGEPLSRLGQFLGLPFYNFSDIVAGGAYNVGNYRGYDKEITWTEVQMDRKKYKLHKIPLSADFREELRVFVEPYNERLFQLTGRRCVW